MDINRINQAYRKAIYSDTLKSMERLAAEYGLENIEQRHLDKAKYILMAKTFEELKLLKAKAESSLFIACLALWKAGKIPGPMTSDNLERKAKRADGIAKLQDTFGKPEAAEKQRQRADELRATAAQLREQTELIRQHPKHPKGKRVLRPKRTPNHPRRVPGAGRRPQLSGHRTKRAAKR